MAEMEDVIKKFVELESIDYPTAQALYNAGITSFKELKSLSAEKLVELGVSEEMAAAVILELEKRREDAEEKKEAQKKKKDAESAQEPSIQIVEEGDETYSPKMKPSLTDDQKRLLGARAEIKDRTPAFRQQNWYLFKRLDPDTWRRPRGSQSKMRRRRGYRGHIVTIGYGGPALVRGLHPSGFEEVLIHTAAELEDIEPKIQAARIAGAVGGRKRKEIEKRADELGIRILNPSH